MVVHEMKIEIWGIAEAGAVCLGTVRGSGVWMCVLVGIGFGGLGSCTGVCTRWE